ncbi:MAG: ribulokinase [Candidatus Geothermincolia bacterium]
MDEHVIGVDFGTDSVRSVIVNARTGEPVAQAVRGYPRWAEGLYCDPRANMFRQHPLDHIECLESTLKEALESCHRTILDSIKGISVDTTGSTPGPVDRDGLPLALHDRHKENPNAMFILWKDHTAVREALEITEAAKSWGGTDFTMYSGGFYSAEWFWSKILHVLREDEAVREAAFSWVEHCDWVPAYLTGNTDPLTMKRGRCAAGHKAMWNASYGGLPAEEFLVAVDPLLAGLRARLYTNTVTADVPAGTLSPEWAERLGLPAGVAVGTGAIDAHMGAVGAGIKAYVLTKVIGTSTSDMLVAPTAELEGKLIHGICGQVDGSIVPGMLGMEAGQSAFGDIFAWFRDLVDWAIEGEPVGSDPGGALMERLMEAAGRLPEGPSNLLAIDWINGRRTPDADQTLKGAVTGLTLGTDAPEMFKALIDAAAFGAKSIVERFVAEGVPIEGVIALGGIPRKAPLVMRTLADVLGMPVKVSASEQTCALGAAMFAATACGIYKTVTEAQDAMGCGCDLEFRPNPANTARYDMKYREYKELGRLIEKMNREGG